MQNNHAAGRETLQMNDRPDISRLPRVKVVLYSLLPVIALLAVLEGGARLLETVWPPLPADYGMGFNDDSRVFMSTGGEHPLMVTRPQKNISFACQSFSTPKPANTYRIFFLGESNVFYLQGEITELAERLCKADTKGRRIEIVNMGGCAYGSSRLLRVAQEIIEYEPDMMLVYIGHNEFEELDQLKLVAPQRLTVQRELYRSAFMRLVRDTAVDAEIAWMRHRMSRAKLSPEVNFKSTFGYEFSPQAMAQRMGEYRNNLSDILSLCADRHVPVIMGSMASNLWKPGIASSRHEDRDEIERRYAAGDYQGGLALARRVLSGSSRHQASDTENGIIRDLAKERGAVLVDIEAAVTAAEPHGVQGETLLSDNCHLNSAGKAVLIREYEREIRRLAGIPALTP